jgi:hypothetical protein
MNSLESVLFQLSNRYITETSIPSQFLHIPDIMQAIQYFKWNIQPTSINGWTLLTKVIYFSN